MPTPLIAVVDDESAFVEMVSEVLQDEGYRTTTSLAARDAWDVIVQDLPELIVLDIRMESPQAGWDLLRRLQDEPTTTHVPIIVCSADIAFLGANEHEIVVRKVSVLRKPFDLDELLGLVIHLVGLGHQE